MPEITTTETARIPWMTLDILKDNHGGYLAAMAMAHHLAYATAIRTASTRAEVGRATVEHHFPFVAAYIASAMIHGVSAANAQDQIEMGDADELLFEWLVAAGLTDEQVMALDCRPPSEETTVVESVEVQS